MRRSLFPDKDSLSQKLTYIEMMDWNKKLCHGKDFEDFKFFPKFLGICFRFLKPGLSVEEVLTMYQESHSFAMNGSLVPQILRSLRAEIMKDQWNSI